MALAVLTLTFCALVWAFQGAVKTGRLPASQGPGRPSGWVERKKTPVAFWIILVFYCLVAAALLLLFTAAVFGFHFKHR